MHENTTGYPLGGGGREGGGHLPACRQLIS